MHDTTTAPAATASWAEKYGDCFEREPVARFLESIVEIEADATGYEDEALIFAIDGAWGTGKSFFIDCWMQDLRAQKHFVAHFDAWKNDLNSQPFIPLISTINSAITQWIEAHCPADVPAKHFVQQHLKKAGKALLYVTAHQAAKHLGESALDSLGAPANHRFVEEVGAKYQQFLHTKSKEHEEYLHSIAALKESLRQLPTLKTEAGQRPRLFIFIDELDRCRPDYAISVIEIVKHIINTRNVCFVVSTNQDQLAKSLKVVYGSEFDAKQYLKRIFHFEYQLPKQNLSQFIENLPGAKEIYGANSKGIIPKYFEERSINFLSQIFFRISCREILRLHRILRIALQTNIKKGIKIDIFTALFYIMKNENYNIQSIMESISITSQVSLYSYAMSITDLDTPNNIKNHLIQIDINHSNQIIREIIFRIGSKEENKIIEFSRASQNAHSIIKNLQINAE